MGSKLQVTPTKLQVTPTKLQVTLAKLQVTPREHSSTIWVSSCIFNKDILINFETRTCSIYEQSIFLFITSR